jgi:hypothetical protein
MEYTITIGQTALSVTLTLNVMKSRYKAEYI